MSTLQIPTARAFISLLRPARDKVAKGGRGSGKSHFFAGLAIEDSLAEPGENAGEGLRSVCIREVQKDLAQSAKLLIESKLSSLGLGEADGFRVYEDCIATPADGLIIFKGMNNYTADSIKSLEGFKRSWWEEAHTATQKSINLLRPTMRAKGSQLWWSYNPNQEHDPVDVMFTGPEQPSDVAMVTANWRDNPWFTDELEQERLDCLRMQPEQYDHIWEGDYAKITEGAYFARELTQAKAENRIGIVPREPLMTCRAVWDIGGTGAKADATAIWIVQHVALELRFIDYYEAVGQPLATHVNWLREKGYGNALCVLPHDGAKQDFVHDASYEGALKKADFEVTVIANQGKGAAAARIEAARNLFHRMRFDETRCAGGLKAIAAYHEKIDEQRRIGLGPNHDWASHGADAFGLAAVAYQEPGKRRRPTEDKRVRVPAGPGSWMGA